eukprot:4449323-Prymnesium_polylepis.1
MDDRARDVLTPLTAAPGGADARAVVATAARAAMRAGAEGAVGPGVARLAGARPVETKVPRGAAGGTAQLCAVVATPAGIAATSVAFARAVAVARVEAMGDGALRPAPPRLAVTLPVYARAAQPAALRGADARRAVRSAPSRITAARALRRAIAEAASTTTAVLRARQLGASRSAEPLVARARPVALAEAVAGAVGLAHAQLARRALPAAGATAGA